MKRIRGEKKEKENVSNPLLRLILFQTAEGRRKKNIVR